MFGRKKKYERPVAEKTIIIPDPDLEKHIDLTIRVVEEGEPCELGAPISVAIQGNCTPEGIMKTIVSLVRTLNELGCPTGVIMEQLRAELKTI